MVDKEMLQAIQQLLEPIQLELMNVNNKISNLDNRITNLEYDIRKGFRETKQDIETIVEVLEAKGVLPKAQ